LDAVAGLALEPGADGFSATGFLSADLSAGDDFTDAEPFATVGDFRGGAELGAGVGFDARTAFGAGVGFAGSGLPLGAEGAFALFSGFAELSDGFEAGFLATWRTPGARKATAGRTRDGANPRRRTVRP